MNSFWELLWQPYSQTGTSDIIIEFIAVFFGILSVIFSAKSKILLYPTGILSSALYVFLTLKSHLLGDAIINGYYVAMSIFGWYEWKKNSINNQPMKITSWDANFKLNAFWVFVSSAILIIIVYYFSNKFNGWVSIVDIFTTGLFFAGMYLLAFKKIENWILLIIGDIIVIPMFYEKKLILTCFFYIVLVIIAIIGYFNWKKTMKQDKFG